MNLAAATTSSRISGYGSPAFGFGLWLEVSPFLATSFRIKITHKALITTKK
jgi:hypothetical protein